MRLEGTVHKFAGADRRRLLETMAEMRAARRGWINLQPALAEEDDPESPPSAGGFFSSRANEIPMATWTAPTEGRKGVAPARIGIQHGAGMRALPWLREVGLAKPDGWKVVVDSPRRGVVLEVPDGVADDDVVAWVLAATARLCPLDLPDRWQATAFTPG